MKKICISALLSAFSLPVWAQVPVSREPMHHDVLDNAHVRLLDVHIPPGDTTQMHIHATPSVFLILSNVKTGSQIIQEENHTASLFSHDGNIWFEGFYSVPRIHRVWNQDTTEFHVMDIELPNQNYIVPDSPIQLEGFAFLFDEKPVRAYRLYLEPGREILVGPRKADILIIQNSELPGMVQTNEKLFQKKGDFLYVPSGHAVKIKNSGANKSGFAFFEIK